VGPYDETRVHWSKMKAKNTLGKSGGEVRQNQREATEPKSLGPHSGTEERIRAEEGEHDKRRTSRSPSGGKGGGSREGSTNPLKIRGAVSNMMKGTPNKGKGIKSTKPNQTKEEKRKKSRGENARMRSGRKDKNKARDGNKKSKKKLKNNQSGDEPGGKSEIIKQGTELKPLKSIKNLKEEKTPMGALGKKKTGNVWLGNERLESSDTSPAKKSQKEEGAKTRGKMKRGKERDH